MQAVCRAFLKGSFKQSLTFRLRNMFSPWGVTFRSRMGWLINIPDYIHSNKYPLLSSHPEMPGIYPKATATVPEILGTLENFLEIDATLFGISTIVADPHPERLDFIFGNSQKAFWQL